MTPGHTSTPLGQRIQRILLDRNGEPISLLELLALLRRQGQRVNAERLRVVLSDTSVFTALPEQRYVLRDQFEPNASTASPAPMAHPLFLPALPTAHTTYVVLDIETSGLDPDTDQIIQIAALRVDGNTPATLRSWYVQCDAERLTPSLRRTLHLTDALVESITTALPINAIWPEVRAFLADHTLVIHNARFDTAFLRHQDPDLPNRVVDTMELALLVVPESSHHNLSALANVFAIDIDALDTGNMTGLPADFRPGAATLHNAITDILLLNEVYCALLHRWHDHATLYATLLPEAWQQGSTPTSTLLTLARLLASAQATAPALPADNTNPSPQHDSDALALLARFATHADLSPRASQQTMVNLVADALDGNHSLLIEAPTGTGKTLGYLIPVVCAARAQVRRIALATAFKNLQDQLREEVARLQQVVPFQAQVLKGAGSYVCLRELQQALDNAHTDSLERRFVLTCLVRWLMHDTTATLDELPYWLRRTFPEMVLLEYELAVDRATCTEQHCSLYGVTGFFEGKYTLRNEPHLSD